MILNQVGTETYGVDLEGGTQTTSNATPYTFTALGSSHATFDFNAPYDNFLGNPENATTGDAGLDVVLRSGIYGGASYSTLTLNSLMGNTTYHVLFLDADTRPEAQAVTFTVSDATLDSITQRYGYTAGTPSVAGYIMDVFTTGVGQTSATFTIATSGTSHGQLDGVLVGTVPEPSTYALFGFGTLALVFAGRRARALKI